MRIIIVGQAAFGEKVLKALSEKGEEIVGVYLPPDMSGKANSFKELATKLGVPTFQPANMRGPEVSEEFVRLKPDLNVLAFVTEILPERLLTYPKLGSIQYHPSLLPKHRGRSAINWSIINGEAMTGITIFWPDSGIDTGPVLLQKKVQIASDDTVGSLYFDKLFPLGVDAIVESVELVGRGGAPRIVQDETQATYDPPCTEEHAVIDWRKPAATVYNLIRGTNPQPGALTRFRGTPIKIYDSQLLLEKVNGSLGEVVSIDEKGFIVAGSSGAILVKRVQAQGQGKVAAIEFARSTLLKTGDVLG